MASAPGLVRRGRGVWFVGFTLAVLLVGVVFVLEHQAVNEARATAKSAQLAADARSHEAVTQVDRALKSTPLRQPLQKKVRRKVDEALRKVLAGQVGVAVRVWSPAAALRYSSLERDASQPDRGALHEAATAKGKSVTAIDGGLMTTYRALGSSGASVEIVQPDPSYRAPDPGLLGFARGAGLAVATIMLFLILAGVLLDRVNKTADAPIGFSPSAEETSSEPKRARKGKADPLAPTSQPAPKAEPAPEPGLRQKLTRSEQARQAMEVELGQARTQLKTDNERASARVKELENQLGMTQARLQEALVATEAAQAQAANAVAEARSEAARSNEAATTPVVDDERIRELERELETEQMRAGAAEARVKGLEAQLRQQAEAFEAEASASAAQTATDGPASDAGSVAARPEPDPDRVAELETELAAALERAREAEDRAARLQDRLVELDPAVAALETWVPPSGSAADEEGGESFRARLVRNAARRKAGEETLSDEGSQRAR
jgi:hypothetical protein